MDVLLAGAPLATSDAWVKMFRALVVADPSRANSPQAVMIERTVAACVGHEELRTVRVVCSAFKHFTALRLASTSATIDHPSATHDPLAHPDLLLELSTATHGLASNPLRGFADLSNEDLEREPRALDAPVWFAWRQCVCDVVAYIQRAVAKGHTVAAGRMMSRFHEFRVHRLTSVFVSMVASGNQAACAWLIESVPLPNSARLRALVPECPDRATENWLVEKLWS